MPKRGKRIKGLFKILHPEPDDPAELRPHLARLVKKGRLSEGGGTYSNPK
jgi:hypothetical protein